MEQTRRVDRNSYEPSYIQLVRIFQEQIASGKLRSGDRLPSESQLCQHHGVSRMTVRRAINIMTEKDIIVTEKGRGTFVKPMRFWAANFNLSQLQDLLSDSKRVKIRILEASITCADDSVAQKMAIKRGQRVLHIRRLILLREKPMMYHREYLIYDPARPIVESELEVTSLRGIFEGKFNSSIKYGLLSIAATVLKDEEPQLLQSQVASAAFSLEHTFFNFEDRPVSWGYFICPGDTLRFTTVVGTRNEVTHGNE